MLLAKGKLFGRYPIWSNLGNGSNIASFPSSPERQMKEKKNARNIPSLIMGILILRQW